MQRTQASTLLKGLCPAPKGEITAVVTDSRRVEPGCVFVCFEGARVDGHTFAAGAVQQGAAYIVGTRPVEGVPTILLPDVGPWLSPLLTILPIQLYADHLAAVKGLEAGAFRWGGKITRIE